MGGGGEKRAHCFLFPTLWGKSSALSRALSLSLSVALIRGGTGLSYKNNTHMRPQTIAEKFLFLANSARKVVQADNLKKYYFYILLAPLAAGRYPPLLLFTLTPFQQSPQPPLIAALRRPPFHFMLPMKSTKRNT